MSAFVSPTLPRRIPRRTVAGAEDVRRAVAERQPVILEGATAHFELLEPAYDAPEALLRRLAVTAGSTLVKASDLDARYAGRLGYVSPDDPSANFRRIELPFAELADLMLRELATPSGRSLYMQATALRCFPGLAEALRCPLPIDPVDGRIWIGTGQRVATHYDESENLACLLAGDKRATLFPPEQLPNLYAGPIEREWTAAGVPESPVDPAGPDLERFPRFAEALAHAQQADLRRGDLLYIPPFWWHHMESTRFNVLVNFWWRDLDPQRQARAALVHAILALRDQPAEYRARWRNLFDYYVFRTSGDPYAGVPTALREERSAATRTALEGELRSLLRAAGLA